jgi:hypothetical protein
MLADILTKANTSTVPASDTIAYLGTFLLLRLNHVGTSRLVFMIRAKKDLRTRNTSRVVIEEYGNTAYCTVFLISDPDRQEQVQVQGTVAQRHRQKTP